MRIHLLGWVNKCEDTIRLCDRGGVITEDSADYYVSDEPHKFTEIYPKDWKDIAVIIRESKTKKGLYITIKCGKSAPFTHFTHFEYGT